MALEYTTKLSKHAAEYIIKAGCFGIIKDENKPIKFSAGWHSPVYCDGRRILGMADYRSPVVNLMKLLITEIQQDLLIHNVNIAGGETAGIAWAGLVAQATSSNMIYVRKAPKGHGTKQRVEGYVSSGPYVLVEDIMTDGASKINFITAMREEGIKCNHVAVPVYYNCFPNVLGELEALNIKTRWLCTIGDIVNAMEENNLADPEQLAMARAFLADPIKWSGEHGGRTE